MSCLLVGYDMVSRNISWYEVHRVMYLIYHVTYLNKSWYIEILYTPSCDICWVMTGHQWKVNPGVDNRWTASNITILYFITTRMLTSGHLMYRITRWWRHERSCETMKAPEQTEQQLPATEQVLYPSSTCYWFTKYQLHVVGFEHGCFIGQNEDLLLLSVVYVLP